MSYGALYTHELFLMKNPAIALPAVLHLATVHVLSVTRTIVVVPMVFMGALRQIKRDSAFWGI
jgi:hypothetical protein